jgi:putative addiction module component (TIGR02574 family)
MTTIKIREKVHNIIDNADERILKVVYAMLKEFEKTETTISSLTDEQQEEIERRWKNHKSSKSKSYSLDEVNKLVKGMLKK